MSNKPRADTPEKKREEAQKLAILFLGDPEKGIEPRKPTEIQRILHFKSDKTYKDRKKLAIELGLLHKNNFGRVVKPELPPLDKFKFLKDVNEVLKSPIIDKWWKKKSKKNKGKGIKQQWTFIRNLLSVFNTCNITPEMLVSRDTEYVEEIRDQYMTKYRENKEWRISKNSKHGNPDTKEYNINQALASLCAVYSISWERGTESMPRVVQGHGKYKNVRFSKEEFRQADKYLIEKFGIDSDPYRWFWIGVETMSRAGALIVMKLNYEEVFNKDGSTKSLHMDTFESKLEHTKKGGDVEKFVRRPNTIKSVKALRSRGCANIYENKQGFSKGKLIDYFTQTMKDLYTHLGHDETEFFFIRPNHTLRHLGAQFWLLKSKFRDFGIVAEIGDWSNITELSDSYGGTPPEVFQETIDGYDYSD